MPDSLDLPIAVEAIAPATASPGTDAPIGDITVADVPASIHEQTLSRLSSTGASAHEHFVTYGKILDYAYEADRKMVSLVQSLGVREVTSRSGQAGVPIAGAEAAATK